MQKNVSLSGDEFIRISTNGFGVYRASDELTERPWLDVLEQTAEELQLSAKTRAVAAELYLSELPIPDRSKPVTLAASTYTACLITGEEHSQGTIASAYDVSRLSVQKRWKPQLRSFGLSPPEW